VTAMTERQLRWPHLTCQTAGSRFTTTLAEILLATCAPAARGLGRGSAAVAVPRALDHAWRSLTGEVSPLATMNGPAASKGQSPDSAQRVPYYPSQPRPASCWPGRSSAADPHTSKRRHGHADRAPRAELTRWQEPAEVRMRRRSWRHSRPNGCSPWRPTAWEDTRGAAEPRGQLLRTNVCRNPRRPERPPPAAQRGCRMGTRLHEPVYLYSGTLPRGPPPGSAPTARNPPLHQTERDLLHSSCANNGIS